MMALGLEQELTGRLGPCKFDLRASPLSTRESRHTWQGHNIRVPFAVLRRSRCFLWQCPELQRESLGVFEEESKETASQVSTVHSMLSLQPGARISIRISPSFHALFVSTTVDLRSTVWAKNPHPVAGLLLSAEAFVRYFCPA